jgi:hypothetical protein
MLNDDIPQTLLSRLALAALRQGQHSDCVDEKLEGSHTFHPPGRGFREHNPIAASPGTQYPTLASIPSNNTYVKYKCSTFWGSSRASDKVRPDHRYRQREPGSAGRPRLRVRRASRPKFLNPPQTATLSLALGAPRNQPFPAPKKFVSVTRFVTSVTRFVTPYRVKC